MRDNTTNSRRERRTTHYSSRTVAAIVGAVSVMVVLTACSGSPSNSGSDGSAGAPSAIGYAQCMRAHGVPNYPDPDGSGRLTKANAQQFGVSSSALQAAQRDCQNLLPASGSSQEQQQELQCATAEDCAAPLVQHWMTGLRTLAKCMRSHGTPNWPDPILDSNGVPEFDYAKAGIDHHSQQVQSEISVCIRITGFTGLPMA